MTRFRKLNKILSVLLVLTMLLGSVPAYAAGDIVINSDGSSTLDGGTNTYSDKLYTGVSGNKTSQNLGNNVNSIKTVDGYSASSETYGIYVKNGNSVSADSLVGGIAVNNAGDQAYGIGVWTASTGTLNNVGSIQATGKNAATGIYFVGNTFVDFISGSTINATSTTKAAYGIYTSRSTMSDVRISNLRGITSVASGSSAANAISYGIANNGSVINVEFDGADSYVNSESTGSSYGVYARAANVMKVKNLGSITANSSATSSASKSYAAYGTYNFNSTSPLNVTFAGEGSKISVVSTGKNTAGYGMYTEGTNITEVTGTTITDLNSIEVCSSNGGAAYGVYSLGAGEGYDTNISLSGAAGKISATSNSNAAYGIYSSGVGTTAVTSDAGGATIDVSGNTDSAKIYLKDQSKLALTGFNITDTAEVDSVRVASGDPTLSLENSTLAGSIKNAGEGTLHLELKENSTWKASTVEGKVDAKMSGSLDLRDGKIADTHLDNVTLVAEEGTTVSFDAKLEENSVTSDKIVAKKVSGEIALASINISGDEWAEGTSNNTELFHATDGIDNLSIIGTTTQTSGGNSYTFEQEVLNSGWLKVTKNAVTYTLPQYS